MMKHFHRSLSTIFVFLLASSLFLAVEVRVAYASYDVTIWSWDSVQGWLAESITMDGIPTGYSTPHTFTGLTGTHTFTLPDTNAYGTIFTKWSTGETTPTITVSSGGTFTAQYYVWWIGTVDASSSDVGRGSSIALDYFGSPHIGYIDFTSDSLKYASWAGFSGETGVWDVETVDPTYANVKYNTASLVLDSSDVPHIGYSNGYLTYATKVGTSWPKETVDSTDFEDGRWCSVKLDSNGYPHICYVASVGDLYVKYAWWTGSAWSTEYLASSGYTGYQSTSLALDSLGKPHACWFFSGGGFTSPTVFYSNKTGATWGTPVAVASGLTSSSGHCSIAIDSLDRPCIAYYEEYNDGSVSTGTLKLARWTGSSWSIETVDPPRFNNDWVGQYTSIVMDYMDRPHISYYDSWWTGSTTAGVLKYAWWTGSFWSTEVADPTWNVGKWSSLAVNYNGKVHISYYDETNKCLKYATHTVPNFDSHEYFFQVFYDPLDANGDGKDDAIKATMDVDSTYIGTQKIAVLSVLRDPYDSNCAWNYTTWHITDAAYDYGEETLHAPPGSSEGWYDVILIIYDNAGHVEEQRIDNEIVYLYPPTLPPTLTLENVQGWHWTDDTVIKSVAAGDVDADGNVETVTGGYYWDGARYAAQLCVWDAGTLALENVKAWYWTSTTLINSVAVGDVDGDTQTEIVTGGYYNDGTRNNAQLCVWTGATLSLEKVKTWYWTGDTEIVSVAVSDVDADGLVEIVTGGSYYDGLYIAQLCVWSGATLTLENVKTWYWTGFTYINSVCVADVDGDAQKEIVTGGVYWDGSRFIAQLCVWSGATLALENVKTWYWTGNTYIYSVAAWDVDGDAQTEIMTGGNYNDGTRLNAQLCVWHGATLAIEKVQTWHWTSNTDINSVAVGDVDGDAQTEIVTGGYHNDGTRKVAQLCIWNGATLALKCVKTWYWTNDTDIGSIAVADVNGDAQAEIVTGGGYHDGTHINAQLCVWAY